MSPTPTPRHINLHPENHTPASLAATTFAVIVLGSGPAGRTLASQTSSAGLSTLIIEAELFGGDCPYWACIPSKALLRPAESLSASRGLSGARELISPQPQINVQGVFSRRDAFTSRWDDSAIVDISLEQGCTVVRGRGRLLSERTVAVTNVNGEKVVVAATQAVVLATGSDPVIRTGASAIAGLSDVPFWTPREATAADMVPAHLVIVGAGPVGCEMATAYAGFGGRVTLLNASAEILPALEARAGMIVREALRDAGVDVRVSVRATRVRKNADDTVAVELSDGSVLSGTTLLVAAGRTPRTREIGLEELGIKLSSRGRLGVDASLAVKGASGRWLYAIGDANGLSPTTHMGSYQARIAANAIIARAQSPSATAVGSLDTIPWSRFADTADEKAVSGVIFTDPNVAYVGLTVAEAEKRGMKVKAVEAEFEFPGAWVHAEFNYKGWANWVVDTEKKVLVGATFVGREAADLVHASTVAIVAEIPLDRLRHAVPPFPTVSEIYTVLFAALDADRE
ncbi:hypothetical protein BDW74DRAFT_181568 [Aspergillus multicolor]|uniref:dihydrolipoyl dehydrogenase family protein n=1 Tax=Aspergillus multicolor TaxID=41759 RepID=UPI003CCD234D